MPGAAVHVPIRMAQEKKKKKQKENEAEARKEEQRVKRRKGAITGEFVGEYRAPVNLCKVVPGDVSFKSVPARKQNPKTDCNLCFQTKSSMSESLTTLEEFLSRAVEKETGRYSSLPAAGTGLFYSPLAFVKQAHEFSLECQTLLRDWKKIVDHSRELADAALEKDERKRRVTPLDPQSGDADEIGEYGFSGSLPYHFEHIVLSRDLADNNLERKELEAPYKNNISLYIRTLRSVYKEKRAKGDTKFTEVNLPSAKLFADDGMFTGENLMHIFVVKQDEQSKKNINLLLDQCQEDGVPRILLARATGLFFQQPFVMRPNWRRPLLNPILNFFGIEPIFSNPYSACYFGELPFSFAASVGNTDAMEAMYLGCRTAQKEDEDEREWIWRRATTALKFMQQHDMHGNTALHMAVRYKQRKVVEWFVMKCKWLKDWGCFKRLNFDQLTPLTLAVQLGHMDLFQYMVDRIWKKRIWQFGRCSHVEVELDQIDSWQETLPVGLVPQDSELKTVWLFPLEVELFAEERLDDLRARSKAPPDTVMWTSQIYNEVEREFHLSSKLGSKVARRWRNPEPLGALEVAVKHEIKGASRNPLFQDVVMHKWVSHVRSTYLFLAVIPYIFFVVGITLYAIDRSRIHREALAAGIPETSITKLGSPGEWVYELAFLGVYTALLIGRGVVHLRVDMADLDVNGDRKIEWDELESFLFKNMVSAMSFGIVVLMWVAWALRAAGAPDWEMNTLAVLGVLTWVHASTYLLPFRFFGILILSVHRMIVVDLLKFLVIYGFALLGFSLGIHVLLMNTQPDELNLALYKDCGDCDRNWWAMTLRYLWASLGEIDLSDLMLQSRAAWLTLTLHIVFVIISTVLLLNLLIALLSRTFVSTEESGNERWWHEFAGTVLRHEDFWTKFAFPLIERFSPHLAAVWSESMRTGKPAKGKCLEHKYRLPYYYPDTRSHQGEESENMDQPEDDVAMEGV